MGKSKYLINIDVTRIQIKQRKESREKGELMDGFNTDVFMDEKQISHIQKVEFFIHPGEIAYATIVLHANVEVDGNILSENIEVEEKQ